MQVLSHAAVKKTLHEPRQLCDDILSFLQKEGYETERHGADSLFIAFDKDDENYFVAISETDTDPLYLRIGKAYPYDDSIVVKETVENAVWDICDVKGVKLNFIDDGFSFDIEFFLVDTEQFQGDL